MIELKEKLELTKPRETDAEISYQNFFRKYFSLSGMTGTGVEIRKELSGVFYYPLYPDPIVEKESTPADFNASIVHNHRKA